MDIFNFQAIFICFLWLLSFILGLAKAFQFRLFSSCQVLLKASSERLLDCIVVCENNVATSTACSFAFLIWLRIWY